jgi:predicted AAA+ superfamily ATPase
MRSQAAGLGWLLEEHARQSPGLRESGILSVYLDEVQVVPEWETLVRRLMDTGGIEIFVSGSSAKLLSREVATSLRGRAMEVLVHPFSFREALRHAKQEPNDAWERLGPADRAGLDAALRRYLEEGGFPEAQHTERRDRLALLWARTEDGWEVDFFAQRTGDTPLLVQVCLDTAADSTWEREVRALTDAAHAYPDARALLITLDPTPPTRDLPAPLEWRAASQWLLAADSAR